MVLICISLITKEVEHVFSCYWPPGFLVKVSSNFSVISSVIFLLIEGALYILDKNLLFGAGVRKLFSYSVGCLFAFLTASFDT